MDIEDEKCGRMDEIHQQLQTAYCQFSPDASASCEGDGSTTREVDVKDTREVDVKDCQEKLKNELHHPIQLSSCPQVTTSCNVGQNSCSSAQ